MPGPGRGAPAVRWSRPARALAAERGVQWLQWQTAPDNATAQRLYDSLGGERYDVAHLPPPHGAASA